MQKGARQRHGADARSVDAAAPFGFAQGGKASRPDKAIGIGSQFPVRPLCARFRADGNGQCRKSIGFHDTSELFISEPPRVTAVLFLRRPSAANPRKPNSRRQIVVGSGTGAVPVTSYAGLVVPNAYP